MPSAKRLELVSNYKPAGDQPKAIKEMVDSIQKGNWGTTLLGVTGSGKTYAAAKVMEQIQRPVLVMAHNKVLAAQLYSEFKELYPNNAVEYFVSYFDYFRPEAYVSSKDLYIEKESQRSEDLERMRNSATQALLTRRDAIVVCSVSCIYGMGSREYFEEGALKLKVGEDIRRDVLLRELTSLQYVRNDVDFGRSKFRVRGDTIDVQLASEENPTRIEMFDTQIERIRTFDLLTGEILGEKDELTIFPATQYVTPENVLKSALVEIRKELDERIKFFEKQGKLIEAQRIKERTNLDLEMLEETGVCNGIENYSMYLTNRKEGERPYCLLDFLPDDAIVVVDESHVSVPQIRGMSVADRSRKTTLVEYGFRLPSAIENRPLTFEEWEKVVKQVLFVSATPGPYEEEHSKVKVEQIIRPTGLVDPTISVKPSEGQVDDLMAEVQKRIKNNERTLVTTLTKRMAEDLATYFQEAGIKSRYLHSDIDTLERIEILRDLRLGVFDVLVGVNMLREGLDLPEVGLIAILDADKEGFLRGYRSLIQTIGRAARNINGHVIMYADRMSDAMTQAIDETNRRRQIQMDYNEKNGITPQSIIKAIYNIEAQRVETEEKAVSLELLGQLSEKEIHKLYGDIEKEMKRAAKELEFERAAELRDRLSEIRSQLNEATFNKK